MKKTFTAPFLIPLLASILLLSCKKTDTTYEPIVKDPVADLSTMVNTASISGFVTDENNHAVAGATVSIGTATTVTTDQFGFFQAKNIAVVKNAAVVVVNKPGYFKGIKTFIADENKAAFFRIKLLPKTNSGNFNAVTGGNVILASGLKVELPAGAVVNAATNTAYTGPVNVAAHMIDPTAADLYETMPGDLRGINTNGSLKMLTSYGMAAIELTGTSGELLQIAPGKKATLTMPIPTSISGTAPATIPLWWFDETKGLWMEDGQGIKTGNTYSGQVSHFSFWNFDDPGVFVRVNCTIKDNAGNPISFVKVRISVVNTSTSAYGYTDSSGYISGTAPSNAQLLLSVYQSADCLTPIYTQNFTSTNTDISLGTIIVNVNSALATVSGTVTGCNNNPVTNGYIMMSENGRFYRYSLSNTGTYNFTTLLCGTTVAASFIGEDLTTSQQSNLLTQTLSAGTNTITALHACAVSTNEFVTYTIDGGAPITYTPPTDTIISAFPPFGMASIWGGHSTIPAYATVEFYAQNMVAGGTVNLETFEAYNPIQILAQPGSAGSPISIHITECGAAGEFVAGNFSGTIISYTHSYNVTCSFRTRRH